MKKTIYIGIGIAMLLTLMFSTTQTTMAQNEDVGRLLQELEKTSDRFSKSFDNAMDNSEINGTSTEGEATRYVQAFEDSIDHLKREHDRKKDTKLAARDVIDRAKAIDGIMKKYKFDEKSQTDWRSVKIELARLARAHALEELA